MSYTKFLSVISSLAIVISGVGFPALAQATGQVNAPTGVCPVFQDQAAQLSWDPQPEASGFAVSAENTSTGEVLDQIVSAGLYETTISGLINDVQYRFTVKSIDENGQYSNAGTYCLMSGEQYEGNSSDSRANNVTQQASKFPDLGDLSGEGVAQMAGSSQSGCAIDLAGLVHCWTSSTSPKKLASQPWGKAAAISGFGDFGPYCAISESNKLWCWGKTRSFGPTFNAEPTAVEGVLANENVVKVSVNFNANICAITDTKRLACWGENLYGQLGYLSQGNPVSQPAWVMNGMGEGIKDVAAGVTTCALTTEGLVKCWGYKRYPTLDGNTLSNQSLAPFSQGGVFASETFSSIVIANLGICGLSTSGKVACVDNCSFTFGSGQQIPGARLCEYQGDGRMLQNHAPSWATGEIDGKVVVGLSTLGGGVAATTSSGVSYFWAANNYHYAKPSPIRGLYQGGFSSGTLLMGIWNGLGASGETPSWLEDTPIYGAPDASSSGRSFILDIYDQIYAGSSTTKPLYRGASALSQIQVQGKLSNSTSWVDLGTFPTPTDSSGPKVTVPTDGFWLFRARASNSSGFGSWNTSDSGGASDWRGRMYSVAQTGARATRLNVGLTAITSDGFPLQGGSLTWRTDDGLVSSTSSQTTDTNGYVRLAAVVTGPIHFTIRGGQFGSSGFRNTETNYTAFVSSSGSLVLTLASTPSLRTVSVKVKMPDGRPVSGAAITAKSIHIGRVSGTQIQSTVASANTSTGYQLNTRFLFVYNGTKFNYLDSNIQSGCGDSVLLCTDANGLASFQEAFVEDNWTIHRSFGISGSGYLQSNWPVTDPNYGLWFNISFQDAFLSQTASTISNDPRKLNLTATLDQMPVVIPVDSNVTATEANVATSIGVRAVDGAGNPIEGLDLSASELTSPGITADSIETKRSFRAFANFFGRASTYCEPVLSATTDADGLATFTVCPSANQTWVVDGSSIVASAPIRVSLPPSQTSTPTPTISGTFKVGSTLTAIVGTWDQGVTLATQWLRDGEPIRDATKDSYQLVVADAGSQISVQITGTATGFATAVQTSSSSTVGNGTQTKTPTPNIVGVAKVGLMLTANTGQWDEDVSISYQWFRDESPIEGATANSYRLITIDAGSMISIRVSGSKTGYEHASMTSVALEVPLMDLSKSPSARIIGSSLVGSSMTVTSGTWDSEVVLAYKWLRDGQAIDGATKNAYTTVAADVGRQISVQVTGSKNLFKPKIAQTANVIIKPAIASLRFSGIPKVGNKVWVAPTIRSGKYNYSYQWLSDGEDIQGSTQRSLNIGASQAQLPLAARVCSFMSDVLIGCFTQTFTEMVELGEIKPRGSSLKGPRTIGSQISVSLSSWADDTEVSYKWFRDGNEISGETNSTLTLTLADRGHTIAAIAYVRKSGYQPLILEIKSHLIR